MLCDKIKKIKSNWYWLLCSIPFFAGLVFLLLSLSNVVEDTVRADGLITEYRHNFLIFGCMLVTISNLGVGVVFIIKRIHRFYKNLKKS